MLNNKKLITKVQKKVIDLIVNVPLGMRDNNLQNLRSVRIN